MPNRTTKGSVYRQRKNGKLGTIQYYVAGRRALIDADDLEAWIKNRKTQWLESRKEAKQ